jgi:chemotaxis protein MotB
MRDTVSRPERPTPRWHTGILLLGVVACGSACGVSQELYNQRTTELDRCKSDLARTQGDLTHERARADEEAGTREHAQAIESEYLKLRRDLNATEKQLEELKRARVQAEARTEVYRNLIAKLRSMIEAKTIAVEIRKGKMLVKLGDQILFDAGKAELKVDGQTALRQIAAALKEIPDRDFLVAGHTDNAPIKSSPYRSNWELSTARAVTVVRFLQTEGVDPRRLAAAGYSEFDPLAENEGPGRAQNRRIEVVVMPRLDELPSIDTSAPPPDAPIEPPSDATPAPSSLAPAPALPAPTPVSAAPAPAPPAPRPTPVPTTH